MPPACFLLTRFCLARIIPFIALPVTSSVAAQTLSSAENYSGQCWAHDFGCHQDHDEIRYADLLIQGKLRFQLQHHCICRSGAAAARGQKLPHRGDGFCPSCELKTCPTAIPSVWLLAIFRRKPCVAILLLVVGVAPTG